MKPNSPPKAGMKERIDKMLEDRKNRKCTCNNPDPFDKDVVHRKDAPCYYKSS